MKTIKIYCKACGVALTDALEEVKEQNLRFDDGEALLNKGQFGEVAHNNLEHFAISRYEGNMLDHTESLRFQGCCGSSGSNGYNKLCINSHEVGTEVSDCWTPHYIAIDKEKVIAKEIKN
ncbi:MAG: hypothetical protein V4581_08170 [Bacteroidota bacterium]